MSFHRAGLIGLLFLMGTTLARAQQSSGAFTAAAQARLRFEAWDWFEPQPGVPGDNAYGYFGLVIHGVLGYDSRRWFDARVDLQNTTLLNLPEQSNAPPPAGDLGLGASYFATHQEANLSRVFLNQGYLTIKSPTRPSIFLRAGRFEFQDGLEVMTGDPALDWLKRARLGARLVSTVGFTHSGRSLDGVWGSFDQPRFNVTALATHPRQGVFEPEGMPDITEVDLGLASVTLKPGAILSRGEFRFFYLNYGDKRSPADTVLKVDNRAASSRAADSADIRLHQFGLHAVKAFPLGSGEADLLFWGVLQRGDWGLLEHRGGAYSIEAGYQPRLTWRPWLRAGYFQSTGDDDPTDGTHGTYFITLYTARQFAQFPFYNAMNSEDLFVQLLLRPIAGKLTLRSEFHELKLTEPIDLWYAGSGAFERRGNFGIGGKPSGGTDDLARTLDFSLTWDPSPHWTIYGYVGHAWGGRVVESIYGTTDATFAYLELTARF
jgi:hypothetical protein